MLGALRYPGQNVGRRAQAFPDTGTLGKGWRRGGQTVFPSYRLPRRLSPFVLLLSDLVNAELSPERWGGGGGTIPNFTLSPSQWFCIEMGSGLNHVNGPLSVGSSHRTLSLSHIVSSWCNSQCASQQSVQQSVHQSSVRSRYTVSSQYTSEQSVQQSVYSKQSVHQ